MKTLSFYWLLMNADDQDMKVGSGPAPERAAVFWQHAQGRRI